MIKLVASDIDGTLVYEGCPNLNPQYFEVIKKLKEKGIVFAAASGRHAVSVKAAFAPVKNDIAVLSQNGCVLEYQGWKHVLKPIPRPWLLQLWQELKEYPGIESVIDTAEESFCPFDHTEMFRIVKDEYKFTISATGSWENIPEGKTYSMASIYHPKDAKIFLEESGFPEKWKERLNIISTGQCWADCITLGNSKGTALQYLAEKLNIKKEEIIAFGDNLNDISMLKAAGCGYAVKSAKPEVLQIADKIIPGYEEDGVLQVLKSLL